MTLACCSSQPKQVVPTQTNLPDVPASMRGLLKSNVSFRNVAPVLVSGYGLVVGLNGTGGQPLNDQLAASMERELGLMGVGKNADVLRGTALEGKTPRQVLQDPNVAVVMVRAAVAPGAPIGSPFDVVVDAMNASSLEGGRLWSTELRLGPATSFGGVKSRKLAAARGPLFTNPFAAEDALAAGENAVRARVLSGGVVTDTLNIVLSLNNPGHGRASQIVSAINSRFPSGAGDAGPIARGRSDASVEVSVPARMAREPGEFLRVLQNLQIDASAPELYARRYTQEIIDQPELAEQLSWALEALGPRAIAPIRELYDSPELAPRLAGLRAGAKLNDARAAVPLRELAKSGRGTVRTRAIAMLTDVDAGAGVDITLRELLAEDDLQVRVAAYEALAARAERAEFNRLWRLQQSSPDLKEQRMSPAQLEDVARTSLSASSIQGVDRRAIEGKFLLDRIPGGSPMIYVTQQGVPRVVLFGGEDRIATDKFVNLWNDRLLIAGAETGGGLKVQYRRPDGRLIGGQQCRATITDLIKLLATRSTPEDPRPGLDFSYGQVVAVLAALEESGAVTAAYATESDRLRGEILAAADARDTLDRPLDSDNPGERVIIRRGGSSVATGAQSEGDATPTIVPVGAAPGQQRR
jgi:hypothetical protein